MALEIGDRAPYGPGQVVIDLIEKHRAQGLRTPVDSDTLTRVGVPESLIPRVLQALRLLGLVTKDGTPTAEFDALKMGGEADYKRRLESLWHDVYAEVFAVVDPETATPKEIEDAFRGFEPHGQRSRMVTLFLALCHHAGIVSSVPRTPAPGKSLTASSASRSGGGGVVQPGPRKVVQRAKSTSKTTRTLGEELGMSDEINAVVHRTSAPRDLPDPLVQAYFGKLPPGGAVWPTDEREKWLKALRGIFDIVYLEQAEQAPE